MDLSEFCIPENEANNFRYVTATEREIEGAFRSTDSVSSTNDHMNVSFPTFSRDRASPLASLSSCYLNLERGCDLHREERARAYLNQWRAPAPTWCRGTAARPPPPPVIRMDRLGVPVAVYEKNVRSAIDTVI